jgi:uncharacterized repeat protein (TIGR03987 family)
MDGRLILAITTITLALVFYSIGVWSERRSKSLKLWHVLCFWGGLLFDTAGTTTMTFIANSGTEQGIPPLLHRRLGHLADSLFRGDVPGNGVKSRIPTFGSARVL